MIRSIRGPILALAALAVATVLFSRLGSTIWLQQSLSDAAERQVLPVLWFNLLVDLLVLIGILLAIRWLIERDRRDRSDMARFEHLADVATMSGGFAHEARNLLNAMQTRIELLRKSVGTNEKATERLKKLDELASSMEQLFSDFLTFTRPADDQLEVTDVASLVKQVLEFEELELERTGVAVTCDFDHDAPRALVDRSKLKRALLNLIVNARQAMPDGGELRLRIVRQGKRVRIDVQDTGCGIAQEHRKRIFQTYFTTKSDGTGLGLAIVRRTVEDLGGEIWFDSSPGKGTTFFITLPSVKQHREHVRRMFSEMALKRATG